MKMNHVQCLSPANIFDNFGAECRVCGAQGFGFVEFRDAGVREAADLQDELMH